MNTETRRRFGALAALIAGLFVALALVLHAKTGWLGRVLGEALWQALGIGALFVPLLGFGIALAGFDRLPRLDMKRAALLMGGLTILVPCVLGVVLAPPAAAFDPPLAEMRWPARLVGLIPALLSRGAVQAVGTAGGLLLGFLALSGLTLATFAWHPLQRLEAGGAAGGDPAGRARHPRRRDAMPSGRRPPAPLPRRAGVPPTRRRGAVRARSDRRRRVRPRPARSSAACGKSSCWSRRRPAPSMPERRS
jgi:hypothetical protein